MQATRSSHDLAVRRADFATLTEAFDYAASGETGFNFYDARGQLYAAARYAELRDEVIALARRLMGLGLEPGARIGIVADTSPHFVRFFWACQYAGLVPVPLPATMHIGGHAGYVAQLRRLLESCGAAVAMAPAEWMAFLDEATADLALTFTGTPADFDRLAGTEQALPTAAPDDIAYIQYTSGSTQFPRGVVIDHATVMANIRDMATHGLQLTGQDRFGTWLPFYHDMGLVAFVMMPLATQRSVDFMSTQDFAMRPRKWLEMMSANRTTITSGPPFGYDLAAMRVRPSDAAKWDLSALRVACVGAEMVSPEPLARFAEALAPSGFKSTAFLPCYGMAECALGISFVGLDDEVTIDHVDAENMQRDRVAEPLDPQDAGESGRRVARYVDCGRLLPSFEISIRDENGTPLPDRHAGVIHLRGPSVMSRYFRDEATTRDCLSADGWLDTGDVGYLAAGRLFLAGRRKDVIIIHGRNIWPEDLEYLARTQPGVQYTDAAAFSVPSETDPQEAAVLVIQCRERDEIKRARLKKDIKALVRAEYGIDCVIDLVPTRTLPRTSSGKLARSKARLEFLERRRAAGAEHTPEPRTITSGEQDAPPMRDIA